MFNLTEKIVLTLLAVAVVLILGGCVFHAAGLEEVAVAVAGTGLAVTCVGLVVGSVAFVKYLWFDA